MFIYNFVLMFLHHQVGSFAVFVLRHRDIVRGSDQDLQHIMRVIVLNMVFFLSFFRLA